MSGSTRARRARERYQKPEVARRGQMQKQAARQVHHHGEDQAGSRARDLGSRGALAPPGSDGARISAPPLRTIRVVRLSSGGVRIKLIMAN
jgi:hypothetical protein